jgi:hypothetical protein
MSAERVGSSLAAVLASFEERTAHLRATLPLRSLTPEIPGLERADFLITALEADVAAARAAVSAEAALLSEAAALERRAAASAAVISSLKTSLPDGLHLPGDAAARPPLHELGAASNSGAPPPPPPPPPPAPPAATATAARDRSARPASARAPPPQMALLTAAELESAPSYMRSRLDVSKVNAALVEVQKTLQSKYALLHQPAAAVRALPDAERKRHAAYRALEGEATKGMFFLSEDDLKSANAQRNWNDASGKNILAVLRHVGRLKEFKHGGLRCWQAR